MDFTGEIRDILSANDLFKDVSDKKKYLELILRKVFVMGEKSGMKELANQIIKEVATADDNHTKRIRND